MTWPTRCAPRESALAHKWLAPFAAGPRRRQTVTLLLVALLDAMPHGQRTVFRPAIECPRMQRLRIAESRATVHHLHPSDGVGRTLPLANASGGMESPTKRGRREQTHALQPSMLTRVLCVMWRHLTVSLAVGLYTQSSMPPSIDTNRSVIHERRSVNVVLLFSSVFSSPTRAV